MVILFLGLMSGLAEAAPTRPVGPMVPAMIVHSACLDADGLPIAIGSPRAERCCGPGGLRLAGGIECASGFFNGEARSLKNAIERISDVDLILNSNSEEPFEDEAQETSGAGPVLREAWLDRGKVRASPTPWEYLERIPREMSLFQVISRRYQVEFQSGR